LLTTELNEADDVAESGRARPHRWTKAEAARAARLSRAARTARRHGPPTDDEIERGLRERAVSNARDAEVLLRWLQRPREVMTPGVDLDALSDAQLERLHAGLVRIASLPEAQLSALLEHLLAGDDLVSPS